ncbi:hypothetical protein EMCRGX_G009857 [Ephydatia muelleri]
MSETKPSAPQQPVGQGCNTEEAYHYPPVPPPSYQQQDEPRPERPPPYFAQQSDESYSSNGRVYIAVQQPTTVRLIRPVYESAGDHYLGLSIFLTVLCICCGSWPSLLCTIPAALFACEAQEDETKGNFEGVRKNRQLAIGLNLIAILSFFVMWIVVMMVVWPVKASQH